MRVLQVCHRYFPYFGGIQEHVRNISVRLAKNHDVSIAATDPSGRFVGEQTVDGLTVRVFRSWAPRKAYYISGGLDDYLRENSKNFDVVHAHNYHAFPAFYAAKTKSVNKLVFTPHYHARGQSLLNSLLHVPYRFYGRQIFARADRIICVSDFERGLVLENFRVQKDKLVVIPNGVDLREFCGLKRTGKSLRTVLFVGRLEEYKGVAYLVKVLPLLADDVILEVVGSGSYKQSLVDLAKKLGVVDRVRFFQDLDRKSLLQKYVDADVFVLLSKYEAYGISVGEALASGVPCVVANTSALKDWVDNINVFGVDYPIDLNSLGILVDRVMGMRVSGVKVPDWDDVVEDLECVYEDLVNIG